MEINVRVLKFKINNIKNLRNGTIEFTSLKKINQNNFIFDSSDVIGIYGPNGSSKTAVVNAFRILKDIIVSRNSNNKRNSYLDRFNEIEVYDLINKEEKEAILEVTYFVITKSKEYFEVTYEVTIGKDDINKKAFIKKEKLSYRKFNKELNKFNSKVTLIDVDLYSNESKAFIKPDKFVNSLKSKNKDYMFTLQRLAAISSSNNYSFIFNEIFFDELKKNEDYNDIVEVLIKINTHARHSMHIYDNKEISKIAANDIFPLFIKDEYDNEVNSIVGSFGLFKESIMPLDFKEPIKKYFKEIDIVINKIIPSMHVEMVELGNVILDNGSKGFKCDVLSVRDNVKIPLRLESDGIKKIISLISSLVEIFNNPYSILVVDEFDSGIFEYLLGEILKVIKEEGKGQFLFTSHNLRALEVIKDSIIFSSLDENDRFITYPRISKTENLRNHYLRDLFLGNNEKFSNEIDSYDIMDAFERAGEIFKKAYL